MGLPSLNRRRWRSSGGLDSFPRQSGTMATRLALARAPPMDRAGRRGRYQRGERGHTIRSIKHRSTSSSPFLLPHHSTQDITRRPNIFPYRCGRSCRIGSGSITPIHERHESSSCTWVVGSYLTLIPCEIACWDIGDLGHTVTCLLGEC